MADTKEDSQSRMDDRLAFALLRRSAKAREGMTTVAGSIESTLGSDTEAPDPALFESETGLSRTRRDASGQTALTKRYGRPSEGHAFHQIVPPGPDDRGDLDALRSSSNVLRLPTIFHEEIVRAYGAKRIVDGRAVSIGDLLELQDVSVRREAGLRILRRHGLVRP